MSSLDPSSEEGVKRSQIGIYLPGIIKTLGQHLYSDRSVAIRELIQNANDSLVNRQLTDPSCPQDLRIGIECDTGNDLLVIRDNGAGMTEAEIMDYLSTVGRSGTAEFRKVLEQENREEARRLIGRFGMGLLSAFVIAESVEIRTRSFRGDSTGFTWRCDGGAEYTLQKTPGLPIGSTIILDVKSTTDGFTSPDHVIELVRRYADFIEFPIYIGDKPLPVNAQTAPWYSRGSTMECADYIANRFHQPPMEVIPLDRRADGFDIGGALFIPQSGTGEPPALELYVSRMYIGKERELLPDWARFVGGVIETSELDVTTSRESVVRNTRFQRAQALIGERLAGFITELAISEPSRFNAILRAHELAVKMGALEDDHFFGMVKNHVQFDSDSGKTTIPVYLERASRRVPRGEKTIYFHSGGVESRQHQLLFAANGVPVIDAEEKIDRAFIEKYAEGERGLRAKMIDEAADALFDSVPPGTLEALIGRYADMDIVAKAVSFKPVSIPSLLVRSDRPAAGRLLEELGDDPDIPDLLRELFEAALSGRMGQKGSGWTLYLNSGNEVIRLLSVLEESDEVGLQCMKEVYNSAYLVATKGLSIQEVEKMAEMHTQTVAMLLRLSASLAEDTRQTGRGLRSWFLRQRRD